MASGRAATLIVAPSVRRGEVWEARLAPVEVSEQGGTRPAVVVSRDAINATSRVILVVPRTTYRQGRRIYPSQVLPRASDGGLTSDSVALGEQVRALAKTRLRSRRGALSARALAQVGRALLMRSIRQDRYNIPATRCSGFAPSGYRHGGTTK